PTGNLDLTRTLGNFNVGALNTNGTLKLTTVGAFDITVSGDLQATNAGLLNTQPAINLSSGRDVLLDRINLTATTSGGVKLLAARDVNVMLSDICCSPQPRNITAQGNIDITATAGQITRTADDFTNLNGAKVT